MKKKIILIAALAVLTVFALQCRKKANVKGIELQVSFSTQPLSDNLVTDMTYLWKTTADFKKIDRDFYIYVHFWNKHNMLMQDDHTPVVPFNQWEPNKEYTYTRRIFIPAFIDEFDPQFKGQESLKLVVGIYSPFDRTGKSKSEVLAQPLAILPPPPDTPEIVYETGWYDQETDPATTLKQWRWTGKEARCIVDNPHRDAMLVIRGAVNTDAVKGQKVILKINDQVLEEFSAPDGMFEKTYNIKKDALGPKDEFSLVIATDKPFVPSQLYPNSEDNRELGVMISFLYFR
ncbi:MAG: hypothetical protein MUP19_01550 [Candidatus Aminicenantes bacterium]|nr:hypothetical protein [Candidatus Aminicenantes bacterium]